MCNPGDRVKWAAALTGAPIVSPDHFLSGGKRGVRQSFVPSIASKRKVWISNDFATAHHNVSAIIRAAAERPESNWRMLRSKAAFRREKAALGTIGIVTALQKKSPEFRGRRNAFDYKVALRFFLPKWISTVARVGLCSLCAVTLNTFGVRVLCNLCPAVTLNKMF